MDRAVPVMGDRLDVEAEAARIAAARASGRTIEPRDERAGFDMATAYAIQARLTERRLARGERIVGWKLGYTSAAMREQMGVAEPNFGPLTDAMMLTSPARVEQALLQPKVEPEIALRFARPLAAPATRLDVLAATSEARACLEIVDSVWTDYRFRIEDNTADGSSAALVVLGDLLPIDRLDERLVSLRHNGATVAEGRGADASGHPADGVVWLLDQLAPIGRRLEAGAVVITGGLTRAVSLAPGDVIEAHFDTGANCSAVRR